MRVLIMSVMLAGGSGLAACGGPAVDSPEDTVPAIEESDLQGARDAAAKLGSELKAQLIAAIEAEGPVGGVQVCAQIAPDIAKMVSEDTGFEVGRTSLVHAMRPTCRMAGSAKPCSRLMKPCDTAKQLIVWSGPKSSQRTACRRCAG